MKLLMILVNADHAADVGAILEAQEVSGYSQIPMVLGKGATGRKLGTRAFPGSSTLYFAVVLPHQAETLTAELRQLRAAQGPEEGLKIYSLDTTEML